tara:strand:- start:348 stop:1280 length:933 start_codon:yes stop_codon:yes gene_type:complete
MKSLVILTSLALLVGCGSSQKVKEVKFSGKSPSSLEEYSEKELSNLNESDFSVDPRYEYEKEMLSGQNISFIQTESMLKLGPLDFKEISSISGPLTKALKECVFGSGKKARKYFNYLFKYYSEKPEYWIYRGNCSLHKKNFNFAKRFYLKAKSLGASEEIIYNNLAVVEFKKGDALKAKNYLFKVNSSRIKSHSLLFNQALIYSSFGFFNESERLLDKVFQKNTNDSGVLFLSGFNNYHTGNFQRSVQLFEGMTKSKLTIFDFGFYYANALIKDSKPGKAISVLSRIQAKTKSQKKALAKLKNSLSRGGK